MSGLGVTSLMSALWLATAAVSPPIQNADFEASEPGQAPTGWSSPARQVEAGYRTEVTGENPHAGKAAARLWRDTSVPARQGAFGSLSQRLDATALRGHRIRYTAAVRVAERSAHIGLWLRVDNEDGKPGFFDNMGDRPISAAGWAVYAIDGYVSSQAKSLLLGLLVTGDGDAFIDSVAFEDLGPAEAAPTGEAKAYLDRALDLLEKDHINSAKADWPSLRAEAYKVAGAATRPGQTHTAIRGVITSLGERHTSLRPPTGAGRTSAAPAAATTAPMPTGRMQGMVGVLSLPRLVQDITSTQNDGPAYETAISTFLNAADASKACGFIVDLRQHHGGNMWPGMRGLAPLLGEGSPGTFVNKAGRKPWPATSATVRQSLSHPDAPVAVLLGPRTASAGEMIAMGFVGRPLARSFGQPTAGLSTANSAIALSDGAVLALTSAYVEDRTGHRYEGPMIPDETTADAEQAALAWLAGQGCASDGKRAAG